MTKVEEQAKVKQEKKKQQKEQKEEKKAEEKEWFRYKALFNKGLTPYKVNNPSNSYNFQTN